MAEKIMPNSEEYWVALRQAGPQVRESGEPGELIVLQAMTTFDISREKAVADLKEAANG